MKNLLILILIFFNSLSIFGQDTISSYIKDIREEFVNTNSNLKNYHKITRNIKSKNDVINFTKYSDWSTPVLFIFEKKSDDLYQKDHVYLKRGDLMFVNSESADNEGIKYQKRFYYYNDKLIRVLTKKKDSLETRKFSKIPNHFVKYDKTLFNIMEDKIERELSDMFSKVNLCSIFPETNDNDFKEKIIEREYNKIKSEKSSYTKKGFLFFEEYELGEGFTSSFEIDYTGYFNSSNQLVQLTFSRYDEGYDSDYEYYFKDDKLFFLRKINDFEPDDEKSIRHFYIYNSKPLQILEKKKKYKDPTPFNNLKFVPDPEPDYHFCEEGEIHQSRFLSFLFLDE